MSKRKAQSTLEYVIVLTAIIGAVIAGVVLMTQKSPTTGVGKLFESSSSNITDASVQLPGAVK